MKIDIEWVRKIRTGREEKGEIMVVKLRTEEEIKIKLWIGNGD